jgi:hypothetical protein
MVFMKRFLMSAALLVGLGGCASTPEGGRIGILVMAHGGEAEWNRHAEEAVRPLAALYPTEIAFGMARADTLQNAVYRLERRGVRRIAVVRLFLSGDSFLDRTEKILGLVPGAGVRPRDWDHTRHAGHHMHMDPAKMPLWKVETRSRFSVSREGLLDGPTGEGILVKRARVLSRDPSMESVLLVAHGVGDDRLDRLWREKMGPAAKAVSRALPFYEVEALTMREDWPDKRDLARREIRIFANRARDAGRRVLVIPYRLSGFGRGASLLKGLEIVSDGKGLLPDPAVGDWLVERAEATISRAGWRG